MFDLKKFKESLQYCVPSVTGVPESSSPVIMQDTLPFYENTAILSSTFQSVASSENGTSGTPDQSRWCSPVIEHVPVSGMAVQSLEHLKHREHSINDEVGRQQTLEQIMQYLSQHLNISQMVLMTRFFTQEDIADIARGMYSGKLTALVDLIRMDSRFLFHSIDK